MDRTVDSRLISKNGSQKKQLNWTNQRVAAFFTKRWVENRLYLKFLIQEHTISAAIQESGNCGGSGNKASAYNAGDPGSIPGWGRSSGEGNGNPFQYSCLENPMDGGTW